MSMAPSEERILTEIESRLRRSDPRLAARLALFGHRFRRAQGPARERLSPWQARPRRAARLMLLGVVSTVIVAISVLLVSIL